MLSVRQIASWKSKINNSFTTESELCRNVGPSAFQLQESMLESDNIWCRYLVINCVSLWTFWTPLVQCTCACRQYLNSADCVALSIADWSHECCDGFDSNSGHVVVSILTDLQEFWTYENREVLLPDTTAAAAAAAVINSEASTKIWRAGIVTDAVVWCYLCFLHSGCNRSILVLMLRQLLWD